METTDVMVRATDDEQPRAYVVRKPASQLSEQDVIDFVKARVSKIKHLAGGAAFLDAIPKTPVSNSIDLPIQKEETTDIPCSLGRS